MNKLIVAAMAVSLLAGCGSTGAMLPTAKSAAPLAAASTDKQFEAMLKKEIVGHFPQLTITSMSVKSEVVGGFRVESIDGAGIYKGEKVTFMGAYSKPFSQLLLVNLEDENGKLIGSYSPDNDI